MRPLHFYEVVEILDSPATRNLGLVGRYGVVTGVPPANLGIDEVGASSDPGSAQYSVEVGDDGVAVALRDLRPTGDRVDERLFRSGTSIRVSVDGRIVEGKPSGPSEPEGR